MTMIQRILSILLFGYFISSVYAQNFEIAPNETLSYIRIQDSAEIVLLDSSSINIFSFGPPDCTAISQDGSFVAQSTLDEDDLYVYRLNNQELILQIPWNPIWKPCSILLGDSNRISFIDKTDSQNIMLFEIGNGNLIPITDATDPIPTYDLPDYSTDDTILPSPNGNYILYAKCDLIIEDDTLDYCPTTTNFVLYDVQSQSILNTLEDAIDSLISGRDIRGLSISIPSAYWSPTGQYLLYPAYDEISAQNEDDISIYDVENQRYLDTKFLNEAIDFFNSKIQWSPTANKLVFWVLGRVGEDTLEDTQTVNLRHPVVYDIETETFTWTTNPYVIEQGNVVWSPSGEAFLFIDDAKQLHYADATSGNIVIVDNNVNRIISWNVYSSVELRLVNSVTGELISIINDGDVIDLSNFETNSTILNAQIKPAIVGSVKFEGEIESIDSEWPYTISLPTLGTYTLVVTPYSEAGGLGTAGFPLTINFTVETTCEPQTCLLAPNLSSISNTTNTTPIFTWSAVSGTESYLVSVSSTSTSVQESFVASNVCNPTDCSGTLSQPLTPDTYTASVQGSNATTTSDPSNEITFTIIEDSSPLAPFVVLGQEGVWLRKNSTIVSGDVGTNIASNGPFLADGSEVTVGIGNDLLSSDTHIFGDSVKVKQGGQVYDVSYNEISGLGAILGEEFTPLPLPLVDAFPAVPTITPSTQDFDLAQNDSLTLDAGSYGTLIARKGSTVTFTGGVYHFEEWDVRENVNLLFLAPSEIRVADKLQVDQGSFLGPDATATNLDARDIVIYVTGQNGNNGNLGATPKAAQFGINSTIIANVYVPNGTLRLRQNSVSRGAFLGKWVSVGIGAEVTLESGF